MKMLYQQTGQALIEALLALSAAAVTIAVVTFLVINALSDTTYAKSQTTAAAYAKQGIEHARALRDRSYGTFPAYNGTYCLNASSSTPIPGTCSPANYLEGVYSRQLTFTTSASCNNGKLVTSTVRWTDGQCSAGAMCHDVTIYTCLAIDNTYTP